MLFSQVEALLGEAGIALADVSAFLVCRGPGHATGLRLCKMLVDGANAIGSSRPVLSYDCLELAVRILRKRKREDFTVAIAASRRLMAVQSSNVQSFSKFVPLSSPPPGETIFFLHSPVPCPTGGIPLSLEWDEMLPLLLEKPMAPEESFSPVIPPAQFFSGG
jgi:hypothetical protein